MTLVAAAIGGIIRYILPRRDRYGVVVLPALAASVGALAWLALTWAGLRWDAALIWWITLLAAAGASAATALWLGSSRNRRDTEAFESLSAGHQRAA